MTLTAEQQQRRRDWFRRHWQAGVAFNKLAGITVHRWDPDGVDLAVPYRDDLSAHDGIFHGGVVAALVDTAACGAVAAGHDFDNGSRISTTMLSLQYLAPAPAETLVAHAICTRRGRRTQFAEVTVRSASHLVVARGMVMINTSGHRPGLELVDAMEHDRTAEKTPGTSPLESGSTAPDGGPAEAVQRYFEAANARDIVAMQALFAEEAEWVHPAEGVLRGRRPIAERYAAFFDRGGSDLEVTSLVIDGSKAVVEVRGTVGTAPGMAVVNHYTFDERNLILRLAVYRGPELHGERS